MKKRVILLLSVISIIISCESSQNTAYNADSGFPWDSSSTSDTQVPIETNRVADANINPNADSALDPGSNPYADSSLDARWTTVSDGATTTDSDSTKAADSGSGQIVDAHGDSNTTSEAATESGAIPSGDPLNILRQYAPSDADLAEDYEEYITSAVGPLTYSTQGTGTARTIDQTIFVPPDTIYDGRGEILTANVNAMRCDTSDGEQAESQRPFFLLAPGAGIKNVTITFPGCEGVHMMGDNLLENIVWEDVGEDAASVRSYFPGGDITIRNCRAYKARDKTFQFNAPCSVRIENFTGDDMGKLVRQNGGTTFSLNVDLNNVTVTNVVSAVVQSDSPNCYVRYHNLSYQFTGSGDKSDRVFRDIPPGNVTRY